MDITNEKKKRIKIIILCGSVLVGIATLGSSVVYVIWRCRSSVPHQNEIPIPNQNSNDVLSGNKGEECGVEAKKNPEQIKGEKEALEDKINTHIKNLIDTSKDDVENSVKRLESDGFDFNLKENNPFTEFKDIIVPELAIEKALISHSELKTLFAVYKQSEKELSNFSKDSESLEKAKNKFDADKIKYTEAFELFKEDVNQYVEEQAIDNATISIVFYGEIMKLKEELLKYKDDGNNFVQICENDQKIKADVNRIVELCPIVILARKQNERYTRYLESYTPGSIAHANASQRLEKSLKIIENNCCEAEKFIEKRMQLSLDELRCKENQSENQ